MVRENKLTRLGVVHLIPPLREQEPPSSIIVEREQDDSEFEASTKEHDYSFSQPTPFQTRHSSSQTLYDPFSNDLNYSQPVEELYPTSVRE
jgi:hypothetical protein